MKNLKGKGLAAGLAATLAVSSLFPGAAAASEKSVTQRVYQQLEQFNLQNKDFKVSQVTKEEEKKFTENQLVVKYEKPLSQSEHKIAGGKLVKRFASLGYDVIEVQGNKELMEVAQNYAKLASVTSITRSAYGKRLGTADPKAAEMFHLKNLNLGKAHSLTGKNKVKVGVIDTGVDASHPELKNKITANKNAMNPLKKGTPDSHGTHVAGIIGAEKGNGIGGYGVAPNSEIVSIDVFNRSYYVTDYTIAEGILEAIRQKVKVINMSLGTYYPSPILKDAVQKAIDAGIIVVAAAGNDGANILNYPASFDGVISVGATDENNQLASFSTYGPSIDVVAPGHKVYAPVFDVDKGSSFVEMSGTSMASPVVAGAVSLLMSKYPNLTPYQVNYILTKTARDLGEKGYDLKYGYGMIDPVKLLSFNPKNIPADPSVKEADIFAKAKDLGEFEAIPASGKLQKLNQTDLYKTSLTKGEYIQISLDGTDKFDLKFELLFFKDGEKKPLEKIEVNGAREGSSEGTLFKAEENGTLVVAVKDSFGKYGEAGQSTYKLTLHKSAELLDDGNSMESPVEVESLPYRSGLDNYYTDERLMFGENLPEEGMEEPEAEAASKQTEGSGMEEGMKEIPGDSDFFRFKVPGQEEDGMKAVKISLSGVPGINPSIKLHMIEKMEEGEMIHEMDQASYKGEGKGEELAFNAIAGQEYMVEVTNKPYIDEFMLMFEDFEIDYDKSYSSFKPYQLTIDARTLPADEDGIPMEIGMGSPEEELIEGDLEEYIAKKKAIEQKMFDPNMQTYEDYINMLKDAAVPFEENESKEGYLQTFGDEDWFSFTPKHSSIFEVNMSYGRYKPAAMEVLKYNEEYKDFSYVYSNSTWSWTDDTVSVEGSFTLGLQAGETYYFRVSDPMYRPAFEPYRFTVKSKVKNVADPYEKNDSFENAIKVSTTGLTGNYSTAGDVDTYYFKPGKDGVFGVRVTPRELPDKYKNVKAQHRAEIDPVLVLIEDTNGNGKLEPEEEGNITMVDYSFYSGEERTGFRTKKKSGYFILTFDYFGTNSSLVPYILKIDGANRTDEDRVSKVKNNIPSKPLSLKRNGNGFYATGYMNLTSNKGDQDFYKLTLDKDRNVTVALQLPKDLDGKVTIYNSKGSQVAVSDFYGKGDNEILPIKLKKGSYYVKVEDAAGNASTDPYKITIK
ncbi:putative secreted protein (Por secretion system target) [Cytobacillus oceanisediminis]|uniref:Putative secreted protein (Por secretion system target) n=1 Tax=Cytobacillus oceanisediminis TaxID=665099 RepID=A0A2V2ZZM2_9BACI|nr:S8 family peptidase [Cytobacillus oceanisediminis]PWW29420.1 putative secreted protein (Por secretion system target) [Cytobacillus oceanisediminis]